MKKKQLKKEIQFQIGKDIYFKGTMGQFYLTTATMVGGSGTVMAIVVFSIVKAFGV